LDPPHLKKGAPKAKKWKGTFAADLFGPATVDVGGQRAAILICYERLLAWPMLRSALEQPTLC
jgi:hypothetical protein